MRKLISAWQSFFNLNNWQNLIHNCSPILSGCGIVYELPNFLKRPNESLAIVDMRNLQFTEPHYHPDNNFEIYFILQGTGLVVIGNQQNLVKAGDVLIIPPNKAHFVIPYIHLILGVINTPSFNQHNYLVLTSSNHFVEFDYENFIKLKSLKLIRN